MDGTRTRTKISIKSLLTHAVLWVFVGIILVPILWTFFTSLKTPVEIAHGTFLPEVWRWENYRIAWEQAEFPRKFLNSFIVAITVTLGQIVTSAMAGYALARMEFRGRDLIFNVAIASMLISEQIIIVPLYVMLAKFGWIDSYKGLAIPWFFNGFGVFLFRQFFLTIPKDIEEAAIVDGASRFRILWQIMLPLATPAVLTLFMFTFIAEWNSLFKWLILVKSPEMRNVQLGLTIFQEQFIAQYHLLTAATILVSLPSVILFLLGQRYYIKGIATTGVKG
ncbi:carbohydrate ABC transporter permease [Thermococcus gorgonarius]|uniref:Sugar ABC transporter permease n=1 Tax=Thermococcus gorgonarius TaxID=71997 RepID=A0A2Z2M807_THEGO|nr:carbohydrate ABC transporter permease [Thermococcus gorgonarius]ASJ01463.1 sugar ABC transporter permease [Thermococcus gorgonarius]